MLRLLSLTPRPLYSRRNTAVCVSPIVGWVAQGRSGRFGEEKIIAVIGNGTANPRFQNSCLVTIPTTPYRHHEDNNDGDQQLLQECSCRPSWNVIAHGDARDGKWRGNWRMKWVASTLHTTSEHGVSNIITTADEHTSAASSRLKWRPRRFKLTRPFRRKTKSGFCACAITFQTQSTSCGKESLFLFHYFSVCLIGVFIFTPFQSYGHF